MATNQLSQRLNMASQAAQYCQQIIDSLNGLNALAVRLPFMGGFNDSDFAGSSLAYLNAATMNTLLTTVTPKLTTYITDTAGTAIDTNGQVMQILQQVAGTI
jgi:hypothetical protein